MWSSISGRQVDLAAADDLDPEQFHRTCNGLSWEFVG
jgi:hypothetical protein